MNGILKIVTALFVLVAFFGILAHPNFLSSSTSGVTNIIGAVQKG